MYLTPTYDAACSFVSSGVLCTVSCCCCCFLTLMECIWSAETGFGPHPDHKRSWPPSSTALDVLSTVSARAGNRNVRVSWYARFTRVHSNNLSTQLRRMRTSSTVSPPVPTTVADPEQTADSEQIRVATIALHTEQEKTRNLQEAQVSQRRTPSFIAG